MLKRMKIRTVDGFTLAVEVFAPGPGQLVLRVGTVPGVWMSVAHATAVSGRWRVRALLAGHEQVVTSAAAARQCLFEDLHELFPGVRLEPRSGR
jgi:hypothetical protein